jgi:hypothetical protein
MSLARDDLNELSGEGQAPGLARAGRANRDREVVEQLIGGASVTHIGRAHGLASPGASIRLVDRALDAVLPALSRQQQQRVDLARLDRLLQAWWNRAIDGDLAAAGLVLSTIDARSRVIAALDAALVDDSTPRGRIGMAGS